LVSSEKSACSVIDQGGIRKGKRVLWCLTSGVSVADGRAMPEFRIPSLRSVILDYGKQSSLGKHRD
jgi:hypothetical protein